MVFTTLYLMVREAASAGYFVAVSERVYCPQYADLS